jgi:hypothetical protein
VRRCASCAKRTRGGNGGGGRLNGHLEDIERGQQEVNGTRASNVCATRPGVRGEQKHGDDGRRGANAAKGRQCAAEGSAVRQRERRWLSSHPGPRHLTSPLTPVEERSTQVGATGGDRGTRKRVGGRGNAQARGLSVPGEEGCNQ